VLLHNADATYLEQHVLWRYCTLSAIEF